MKPATSARQMTLAVLGVTALHLLALSWVQTQLPQAAPLVQMADPLLTRLLLPQMPPAAPLTSPANSPGKTSAISVSTPPPRHQVAIGRNVLAAPKTAAASAPPASAESPASDESAKSAASTPAEEVATHPLPVATTSPAQALAAQAAAGPENPGSEPAQTTPSPDHQASVEQPTPAPHPPNPPSPAPPRADTWPPDTRLSYKVSGFFRGELHGSARVQWQREAVVGGAQGESSQRYQVRFDLGAAGITLMTMTSQGEVTPTGLIPRVYEEKLPNGLRRATFDQGFVKFQDGTQAALPPQVQDTASQFVELSHRFSTGQAQLGVGKLVDIWLARPGGLDLWTYEVVKEENLSSARLGTFAAFHLKPRPLANPRGSYYPELWFAPSLQYLPVRVRIISGGPDFVDLLVDQIEQGSVSDVPVRRP